MPAKDLGTKHTCFKCAAKFYDLRKPQAICPKCGADQRDAPVHKPSAAEKRPKPVAPTPAPEAEEAEESEEVFEELDEDLGDDDEP
ncbi:MAG TPA: TIGR02300 family protein [Anaeromyxobacteraceae bacterium]|nr:TIGR02300 family protein [Anaeromyxobacteraceae bacterium]